MILSTALLTTLLFSFTSAHPLISHGKIAKSSLQRRLNITTARNLVRHDQARARYFYRRAQAFKATALSAADKHDVSATSTSSAAGLTANDFNQPIENLAYIYTATIGVGNPPTEYNLLIDTGSSNTWVGNGKGYNLTKTSEKTDQSMDVVYGSAYFSGLEYCDQVALADGLVLTKQSIGVATHTIGIPTEIHGILGIGPARLTQGTLWPSEDEIIPTVTDVAFRSNLITNNQVGIYFAPATKKGEMNGELTWGGFDEEKLTSRLDFVSITTRYPASLYWGIDQNITYGKSTEILSSAAGIVDTGTTLILLAPDAYERYVQATGATMDHVGLLKITASQFASLQSLFFIINGVSYELTPNAQIWPRSLNTLFGGEPDSIYLIVGNIGSNFSEGPDFILGYGFLERFYTVYDTARKQIGFARTHFTYATSN